MICLIVLPPHLHKESKKEKERKKETINYLSRYNDSLEIKSYDD